MKITYESICEKLGFDPLVNPPECKLRDPFMVDDTQPNPYSVLTSEERDFLYDYFFNKQCFRKKKGTERPVQNPNE
jgi:hypothetical protein